MKYKIRLWIFTLVVLPLSIIILVKFSFHAVKRNLETSGGIAAHLHEHVQNRPRKRILLYTALFGRIPWKNVPYGYNFTDIDGTRCPVNDCDLTYDKSKLNESDLVVFHGRDLQPADELRKISSKSRKDDQVWLYFMHESPIFSYTKFPSYHGIFNWTATYRSDSDVLVAYHHYKDLERNEERPITNTIFAKGKKNLISFVNSHCDPDRMGFIKELRKYTQVDVYGRCAQYFKPQTRPCPRGNECLVIQKEYKFYLAVENSFCTDYITEKYWLNALDMGLVPIVLGGGNYSNNRIAVPGSYIDVKKFKTMKQLGDYINYLGKNDTAYNEYHQWRFKYKLFYHNSMCTFCKAAHEHRPPRKTVNLEQFWGLRNCDLDKKLLNAMVKESRSLERM